LTEGQQIAVVGFSTKKLRPTANKKFRERDSERRAAAYLLELLLRDNVEFISVRKVLGEKAD
jgi:hypothetical protein